MRTPRFGFDLTAALFVYGATYLAAGQAFRFPFDDEIYTLQLLQQQSYASLALAYPATSDVHPPLSYLAFLFLHRMGATENGMRLASLVMTAAALSIFHGLTLNWIDRSRRLPAAATRIAAIIFFGLCPLAISYGDAIRWYPLFALLVALATGAYFQQTSGLLRLATGALLGLAASTNLLAAPVALAFATYRYSLERRFRWRFDLSFWLLAIGFGALGIYSVIEISLHRPHMATQQLTLPPFLSLPIDVLGFLGGERLGLGEFWIVLPAAAVVVLAAISAVDRKSQANPYHFLLLLVLTALPLTLVGFAKPRSFLYLAPVAAALCTIYTDNLISCGAIHRAVAAAAAVIAVSAGTIAALRGNVHPFKRELAIPYQQAVDFIEQNSSGSMLILSTDPVLPWIFRGDEADRCVGGFAFVSCMASPERYGSVFIVQGHSDRSGNVALMRKFATLVTQVTAGRERYAQLAVGLDRDADLKERFTGVHLGEHLLQISAYRYKQ